MKGTNSLWHKVCYGLGIIACAVGCIFGIRVLALPFCEILGLGAIWQFVCSVIVCASTVWSALQLGKAISDLDFEDE